MDMTAWRIEKSTNALIAACGITDYLLTQPAHPESKEWNRVMQEASNVIGDSLKLVWDARGLPPEAHSMEIFYSMRDEGTPALERWMKRWGISGPFDAMFALLGHRGEVRS